ncbi:MAG: phosphoribosylformylglycinamidine synthase subunit PurQ [Verrucomicrobiota bacterium]|nr:phosphoribosylformylglycinamidine synthase subunit PurQ [Verrucomicrobiota bacterium]
MKFGVLQFPGSNCDQDVVRALTGLPGVEADYIWHKESTVAGFDALIVPGGFSYGDYLRCGAIARFSPVMKATIDAAKNGTLVLGICNGFQILCEAGLLPGVLIRNRDLKFICEFLNVRVETPASPFTNQASTGTVLNVPIAHGEGCYFAEPDVLAKLEMNNQVLVRYCNKDGVVSSDKNPNGAVNNIAGICNASRNVFGLMPHPERAMDLRLGSDDGRIIFESMIEHLRLKAANKAA